MTDNNELPIAPRRGRPPKVERPEVRTEAVRDEDPRARAERRAAEIREHTRANPMAANDKFYIDPHKIPSGWSYEWKRKTLAGMSDPTYDLEVKRAGWEPVPASRHPDMMPRGRYETIERDGMILMERPIEITEEARRRERMAARDNIMIKEQQLREAPTGTFERNTSTVKRGYQPMDIPKE
jgi:hypothetical protein